MALPGPEVGRPRGHRVGGAGAHGGVHGRELAGAVPARGTAPLRRGSAQTAGGVDGAPSSGPWRRPGGQLGRPPHQLLLTSAAEPRGAKASIPGQKGAPRTLSTRGSNIGRTLAFFSTPPGARPSRGSLKANPKKGGRLQRCIPKKRGRCPRPAHPETWELWGTEKGGGRNIPRTQNAHASFSRVF